MAVKFPDNMIVISDAWTGFKSNVAAKSLVPVLQYDDDGEVYTIFAIDALIIYTCTIWIGTVPASVLPTYSQAQNDSDKSDFETNYKADANQQIDKRASDGTPTFAIEISDLTVADGYTTTSATSFAAIRATTYTEQSTNAQRSVVSDDTNDASAGTGARKVIITYYDQALAGPYTEEVTLNGTTAVNTVATDICYIERLDVSEVGSQLGNLGTISLMDTTGGGGSAIGSIAPGDNETNWVHHYVASDRICRVLSVQSHVKGAYGGSSHLRCATPTISNSPEKTVAPVLRVAPGMQSAVELPAPLVLTGPCRVVLYAKPDVSNSLDWLAGFNFIEETV